MKTIDEFLYYFQSLDIRLWVDGDQLHCNAPKGMLTPTLKSQLRERKSEIIEFLQNTDFASSFSTKPILPVPRNTNLPLSFSQQRLWFLQQLEPNNPFYNERLAIQLTGSLDVAALEQSLNGIVERHEALRTTFKIVEGQPIQFIAPNLTLTLPVVDLYELPEAEQKTEVQRLATEQSQRPFDLVQGPLLRWTLLQLSQQEHVLLLTMHHIVGDGWSLGILIRELSALYQAFSTGKPASLPELPIQYADFALWQRQELQGEKLKSQMSYWKQQLENAPPLLQLPTDRPRPLVQKYRGARQSFLLPQNLTETLKAIGQKTKTTLFMTLLAAFKILLYRYTGQEDIVVGSAIANRNRAEIEGLIGFFINSLVLRTTVSGNLTFEELLGRVRKVMMGAYANQDLPLEKLVEELLSERDTSYNPLFQVSFTLQNTPKVNFELPGLNINSFEIERTIALFDLHLDITESDSGLECFWEYNTDLFDPARISRMTGHFHSLLEAIAANPQQRVSQLPLLTEFEQYQLLVEWNKTQADYPKDTSIHQLFEAQVEKTPDAVAVVFEDRQLTYRQLNQRANQLAHYLNKLGVKPEVLVGIYVERSLEMVIGLLGILKAGGAYVPLDPALPQERLALILSDIQTSVLLTQQQLLNKLPPHQAHVLCLDINQETISQENLSNSTTPENLAYIIYTSGSTGKPKGVQIPHSAVVNFLKSMEKEPGLTESDILLAVTSISFDIAALELYLPLITGAHLELASREVATDGKQLAEKLNTSGATVMQATPATWRMLLVAGWQGNPHLKILCGGEALARNLAEELLKKGATLWNLYGPTETTIWSTSYKLEATNLSSMRVPIGSPIANTQIYLLDSYGQPVPVGIPGELHIGGAGLARGYLNRPELTTEKFITNSAGERLYKSGDLARYLPNGKIEYIERLDHQVKIRGFRIELGEIEALLAQHPNVASTVVVVREAIPEDKRLIAYIIPELKDNIAELPTVLRNFLKEKLPEHSIPSAFILLDALPLTPSGKIDRRGLPAPDSSLNKPKQTDIAPRTPVEEVIAGIWTQVLKCDRVCVNDNFFEQGGHSLLATQLISRLRHIFQIELPLRYVFEFPTLAELAQTVESMKHSQQGLQTPPIVPVPRDENLPLSFAQEGLWFIHQLNPNQPIYNSPAAVRLTGSLNIPAFEQSLNEILRRHEALRTKFTLAEGKPVQVIIPNLSLKIPLINLEDLPETEREKQFLQLADKEAKSPFDLAQPPLLRVTLLKLSPIDHVALFTMHHIATDGWSIGILIEELSTLYESFCSNPATSKPLPELPIQYADFAHWQRQWLQGEVLEDRLAYWKQKLAGIPTTLNLEKLTGNSPVTNQTRECAVHSFLLPGDLSAKIRALSSQEGVTLFMTLLAGFQTLLYRYTNQEDILIGTDVANRDRPEIESIIGFFINILVLRGDLSGNPSFRELLERVREVTLAAYDRSDLPFAKLVEALRPDRTNSITPLFQVLFVLQSVTMPAFELSGLKVEVMELNSGLARFDLALFMEETEQGITGTWKYRSDLFSPDAIARITDNLETLLSSITQNPDTQIDALEMMSELEKQKQITAKTQRDRSKFNKFKKIKPKAVNIAQEELVKISYLQPEQHLPLVIQANSDDIDLADWATNKREYLETNLRQHGAILFRGFKIDTVPKFEQVASAICPNLFANYGDLPREGNSERVYHSTPYPSDLAILFHNESSHLHQYPLKIWFFCVQPAQEGGETPIVDCHKVYQLLDPKLRSHLEQKQLMYVRNYIEGLDVSWQDFFHTTDKTRVEQYCRQSGMDYQWLADNGLRTKKVRPAISHHPQTGKPVFFNQVQLHHISCLEPDVKESLLSNLGEENLPRNVYYGDGSPIEDSVMAEIGAAYQQAQVSFPWQKGDILMLDNMLVAHGRNPYQGSRKIVVAMGEMVSRE